MFLTELFQPNLDEGQHDPGTFKAVIMAGPPGAGKNTVIRKLGLTAAGLKLQDVDQTLEYLKHIAPAKANYDDSLVATRRQQAVWKKGGLGLIINTTGRDLRSLVRLNKELQKAGYATFMVFVDTDYNLAQQRILNREKTATNPMDKRPVDPEYFDKAFDDSKYNLDFYERLFGINFAMVTNNVPLRENEAEDEFRWTLEKAAKKIRRFLQMPSPNLVSQGAKE